MASDDSRDPSGTPIKWLLYNFQKIRLPMKREIGRIVNQDEIEDIMQEAFLQSYQAACSQEIRNPRAFMMKVAKNLALDHIKRAEQRLNCSIEVLEEEILASIGMPETEFESKERFLGFCKAVLELPPQCRKAFMLKKVYGLSQKEIARALSISENTVENQIVKGMYLVWRYMIDKGHLQDSAKRTNRAGSVKGSVLE